MSDEDALPRVTAPIEGGQQDNITVGRGGGAPITDDAPLQAEHIAPEGDLRVTRTAEADRAEAGESPYPHVEGLDPDRPHRETLDNSTGEGVADNRF